MAVYAMTDIFKFIVEWEATMLRSFSAMGALIRREGIAEELVLNLEKDQDRLVDSLKKFDVKDVQSVEFLKNVRNYPVDPPVRQLQWQQQVSLWDVLADMIKVQEELLEEYKRLRVAAQYEPSKNVLDVLIQLKSSQIKKTKLYMESFRGLSV